MIRGRKVSTILSSEGTHLCFKQPTMDLHLVVYVVRSIASNDRRGNVPYTEETGGERSDYSRCGSGFRGRVRREKEHTLR